MKLLLDENLSRRLLGVLRDMFPGSVRVKTIVIASEAKQSRAASARPVPPWIAARLPALAMTRSVAGQSIDKTVG